LHRKKETGKWLGCGASADCLWPLPAMLIRVSSWLFPRPGPSGKQLLTIGEFAIWFLGIELFLGAILPLALLAHPKTRMIPAVQYASAALVIIGIFVMRVIIVIGGQSVPMS